MNFIDLLRRLWGCADPYTQPFGDVVTLPRGAVEKQLKNGGLSDSRRNTCRIYTRNQKDSSR